MPIQILLPQLINQIAAGEVVERPSSVVKELIENSLDAGATRIEIEIERGGVKLIRIRDNGNGIAKNELALALACYATSKIANLDDLEHITSMGFRGEALASISSVSRLTLTSRTAAQSEAWQVYAEGGDLAVTLQLAAHPVGTTVEVLDLFYNTPARRKFMRTEKTEFTHIDEVVRRIALAHFDVTFILQHNGKTLRQYQAVNQPSQHIRRLGRLCSLAFVEQALVVSCQHGNLAIRGWVVDPTADGLPDIQYIYVNQRIIRDKLINHAIRQAYQKQLEGTQQPAFVIFLDVDPYQVDVNVHPAKHEVRFHQARLVHDFIYQAVFTILQQSSSPGLPVSKEGCCVPKNRQASGRNHFALPLDEDDSLCTQHPPGSTSEAGILPAVGSAGQQLPAESIDRNTDACLTAAVRELRRGLSDDIQPTISVKPPRRVQKTSDDALTQPDTASNPHNSFGRVLTIIASYYALVESVDSLVLFSLSVAERCLCEHQLISVGDIQSFQPLLIPIHITLCEREIAALKRYQRLLQEMGIILQIHINQAILNAMPLLLRQQNLQNLIPELLGYLQSEAPVTQHQVATWLAHRIQREPISWSHSQAIHLITEVARLYPQWVKNPPNDLLVTLNLETAIKALNND